ncbi:MULTISPECIES: DUF4350 domain-containing protein [unclassified Sphingomonas]|uniref:DUF4350 domain-containing protein n=1 Tax=unclassified Sphingomonas TaxID=196159 RepID=UPI002150F2C9|nr:MULTISPECIES: DUF4350 domain-containing protein [unclassified Sphingomonas]MCR5872388.1 hypothetical protein [Sphingomonas sp. J344]UUX99322.1 hypothetical protein LRS08_17985 [Sphingomonas sp. J315]
MTPSSANPFRTRTVLLLIGAGFILALGFLLVSAYGDRFDRQRGNVPSPASRFATGFHGLARLVELAGGTVTLNGSPDERPGDGLLILTPNIGTKSDEIQRAIGAHDGPILVILPKWVAAPIKDRRNREQRVTTVMPQPLISMLEQTVDIAPHSEKGGTLLRYASGLELPPFRLQGEIQAVESDKLVPLIVAPDGASVLSQVGDTGTYILADPDLLNNQGLSYRENARAALALLAALDPDTPGTVIFDTMLPYGSGGRNLLQLAFEPPFAGVSIALLIAALLAGIATLARFGPVRREQLAVPFGKAALIDNIVSLARRARRTREGGSAYADAIRDWAARRLALPRTLQGDALDAQLDAIPTTTSYTATAQRVRDAKTETELLHAAQALDDWRKEVKA